MTTRQIAMGLALVVGMAGQAGAMKYKEIGKNIVDTARQNGIKSKQRHYDAIRIWETPKAKTKYEESLKSIKDERVKELIHNAVRKLDIPSYEKGSFVNSVAAEIQNLGQNPPMKKISQIIGAMGRGLRKGVDKEPPIPSAVVFKQDIKK